MVLWNREGYKLHTNSYYTEKMDFCKGDNLQKEGKRQQKTGTKLVPVLLVQYKAYG